MPLPAMTAALVVRGRTVRDVRQKPRPEQSALIGYRFGFAVMNHFRSQQPDSAMAMFGVIPRKELLAKSAPILDGAEAVGKTRAILQRLKLRFRIRIIIGYMRAAVTLCNAEIRQQQSTGLDFIEEPRSA